MNKWGKHVWYSDWHGNRHRWREMTTASATILQRWTTTRTSAHLLCVDGLLEQASRAGVCTRRRVPHRRPPHVVGVQVHAEQRQLERDLDTNDLRAHHNDKNGYDVTGIAQQRRNQPPTDRVAKPLR